MSKNPGPENSRKIAAVDKCCDIIYSLHELEGATLTELSDHLDLTPGTLHPHLVTLLENELVVKQENEYHPGFQFLTIGEVRKQQNLLYKHAIEEIEEFANKTNSRVQIYIEEFGMAVCIGNRGSQGSIYPPHRTGHRIDLHCIAAGKAMLAELPESRVEQILDRRGLNSYTEHTIVDEAELYDELETVAEQGYAFNDEEYMMGLSAVGAIVKDQDGEVLGSISASIPAKRMDTSEPTPTLAQEISNLANTIELNIRVQEEA